MIICIGLAIHLQMESQNEQWIISLTHNINTDRTALCAMCAPVGVDVSLMWAGNSYLLTLGGVGFMKKVLHYFFLKLG